MKKNNIKEVSPKNIILELRETLNQIEKRINKLEISNIDYGFNQFDKDKDKDLENLIGTIPFLLLDEKIFQKNIDITEFAKKIGVFIPSADKKKKEDIIGRIIVSISKFNGFKINELNKIIKKLNSSTTPKNKSNFFKNWDLAIKQMKI